MQSSYCPGVHPGFFFGGGANEGREGIIERRKTDGEDDMF